MGRGGVNERKAEPDQGQRNGLPGREGPAPAQLNNPPTDGHQH